MSSSAQSSEASGLELGRLAVIAVTAGAFSSFFGVGGGIVIVPMLVLWLGFDEKLATGTSLLAIVVIAAFAVSSHALFGEIDVAKGLLVGVPAIAGVVIGTAVQQRMSD